MERECAEGAGTPHLHPAPAMGSVREALWLHAGILTSVKLLLKVAMLTQPDATEWPMCCQTDLFLKWDVFFLLAEACQFPARTA